MLLHIQVFCSAFGCYNQWQQHAALGTKTHQDTSGHEPLLNSYHTLIMIELDVMSIVIPLIYKYVVTNLFDIFCSPSQKKTSLKSIHRGFPLFFALVKNAWQLVTDKLNSPSDAQVVAGHKDGPRVHFLFDFLFTLFLWHSQLILQLLGQQKKMVVLTLSSPSIVQNPKIGWNKKCWQKPCLQHFTTTNQLMCIGKHSHLSCRHLHQVPVYQL